MRSPKLKPQPVQTLDPSHISVIREYLDKFREHSKHLGLIHEHGQAFTQSLPSPYRGKTGRCFMNAYELATRYDLIYVEGVAVPDKIPFPLEHAWVVDKRGRVMDPTWHDGRAYFGIPFTFEYVQRVALRTKHFGILFPRNRHLFDGRDKNWRQELE